jgi:F0F1-type ATP synthase assembly protein I
MAENSVEKADAQVAESIRKLTRATSAMAEAIDEGVGAIKLAVKRSGDLAEEMMDDTTQRVKRHPVETMVATFSVGIIVGGFIGWMVFRK